MVAPDLPKEARDDPFRPPAEPCTVRCLHCGQEYSSAQIVWRGGFWSCPVEGCGGAGYAFDIHPLDSPLWGGGEDEDEDEDATGEESEGEEPSLDAEEERAELEGEDLWDEFDLTSEEIESEEELMRRRQQEFRAAAEAVALTMGQLPDVEKVALFGSVARPLDMEVPRFRKFRREGVEIPHECKDVDLAVWILGVAGLKALLKARGRALSDLFADRDIGVAHHQVDVFLLEPGTNRYLGRLCNFGQCPKGKNECRVPGCGTTPFLRQHERFKFDWAGASQGHIVLYEKNGGK